MNLEGTKSKLKFIEYKLIVGVESSNDGWMICIGFCQAFPA